MDQIQKLEGLIILLMAEDGMELYDVAWHTEGSMHILQMSVTHKDGSTDIDTCAVQSERIGTVLDEMDMATSEYFLEVCSPDAERKLESEEQIRDAIGGSVYVKLRNPRAGMDEIKETLITFENNTVYLDYVIKAMKKKAEIKMDSIALIRLSMKIWKGCEQEMRLKDFMTAMQVIETDRKLSKEVVVDALQETLARTFRKRVEIPDVLVRIDVNGKPDDIRAYQQRLIAESVEDDELKISLEGTKRVNRELELGGVVEEEASTADLGHAAVILAKNVMKQRIYEAEGLVVYEEYCDRVEGMVTGIIESVEERLYVANIGKTLAPMPRNQQTPNERYYKSEMIRVVITEVNEETKGAQILVSRENVTLIKHSFEKGIPKIFQGATEIEAIAWEAGERTRMAVYPHSKNIDPISAYIGPREQRVQVIIDELGGGKINVFEWSGDAMELIKNALSPAEVLTVVPGEERKDELLTVAPDNQLSLAIGKRGKNARPAIKLAGNKVDTKAETDVDAVGTNWKEITMRQREEFLAC